MTKLKFILIITHFIYFSFHCHFGDCRSSRRGKSNPWDNVIASLNAPLDMKQFLIDSYNKMGNIACVTVIWDSGTSSLLGKITFCDLLNENTCAYKYIINYNGNVSEKLMRAGLKAGYREQCGGYVILLKTPKTVTDLLHEGDDARIINTRGRFLIWYQKKDELFERDEIWKKIPNVILFNMTTNTRTRRLSLTTLEIRWPIVSDDLSRSTIRAMDFWRYGKGFKNDTKWYWDKSADLKDSTLRILVVEHPPGVIRFKSPDGNVSYAGVEIEIVKALKTKMNFNIELVDNDNDSDMNEPSEQNQIGNTNASGINVTENFYGAISSLVYGETDMAIGSFFILKHYLEFIDMSIPLDVVCTSFLTPMPLPRPRYLALILPFNWKLWILVLSICLILTPLILFWLTHVKFHPDEYPVFSEKIHVVLTSISIMTQVSLYLWPKFWSVRLFIGGYWLFTLCITLAYRGAMVSFLTIPLFQPPIDTISDLAASQLPIGGWGVELERLFTQHQSGTTEADVLRAFLSNKYQVIDDLNAGIDMVAQGKFALYENIRFLRFIRQTRNLTNNGRPSMRLMKQCIVPVHIGIAYQKNSALTATINGHLRRFGESGLTKKWGSRLVQLTKDFDRALMEQEMTEKNKNGNGDGEDDSESTEQKQRILSIADLQNLNSKPKCLAIGFTVAIALMNIKIFTLHKILFTSTRQLKGSVYLILFGVMVSIFSFLIELMIDHTTMTTAKHVNKLKKFVSKTVSKTKSCIDDRMFLLDYEANFQPRIRQRQKERKNKFTLFNKKQPPFPYID